MNKRDKIEFKHEFMIVRIILNFMIADVSSQPVPLRPVSFTKQIIFIRICFIFVYTKG